MHSVSLCNTQMRSLKSSISRLRWPMRFSFSIFSFLVQGVPYGAFYHSFRDLARINMVVAMLYVGFELHDLLCPYIRNRIKKDLCPVHLARHPGDVNLVPSRY